MTAALLLPRLRGLSALSVVSNSSVEALSMAEPCSLRLLVAVVDAVVAASAGIERASDECSALSSSARAAASFSLRVASMSRCFTFRLSRRCSLVRCERSPDTATALLLLEADETAGAGQAANVSESASDCTTGGGGWKRDEWGAVAERDGVRGVDSALLILSASRDGSETTFGAEAAAVGVLGAAAAAAAGVAAGAVACQSATGMLMTHWSAQLRDDSVTVWKTGSDGDDGGQGDEVATDAAAGELSPMVNDKDDAAEGSYTLRRDVTRRDAD